MAVGPDLGGERLGQGRPSRRRRGHQPRAGGRRGDRADQADPEGVAGHAEGDRCRRQKSCHAVRDAPGEAPRCALAPSFLPSRSSWRRSAPGPPTSWCGGSKGFYAQEDEAVREIVAAFEQKTGKQVELVLPCAGRAAGQGPGGDRGRAAARFRVRRRLTTISSASGPTRTGWSTSRTPSGRSRTCSIPTRSTCATLLDATTGRRGLYALPMGRDTNHVHVWKSLLEQAGFTLADIPKEWEAFWSFWCDQVQPAVRKATGRDDIWGVGLAMSAAATTRRPDSSSSCTPTRPTT